MLKIDFCHLTNTLINTNNKVDDFTKKKSVASNQLIIPHYQQGDA